MLLKTARWLAPLAVVASLQGAHAQDAVTAETVLATVDGKDITAGHLLLMRAQLPQQYQNLPPEALYDGLLQQAISQVLLGNKAGELGPVAKLALENEERALLANSAMRELVAAAVTPEAIQAAYDETYLGQDAGNEYSAAHILVESEEEARALIAQLNDGADFAALAAEHSTGPSGPNGGDLGWFAEGAMVKPFEDAVLALEAGQVSAPVETQFGWHVIRLNGVRAIEAPTLEEVQGDIANEIQRTVIDAEIEALREAATVDSKAVTDIDAGFLNNPALLDE
ncbi:peptidylprolyl isomerase [Fluviibacterium sp. DFM31]|uniref:Parvulin-like PPIase n=1 Tax=Meridianimarinicoccus marinus TaxID=3231483 RepID=A0ABV3L929_9RHOB